MAYFSGKTGYISLKDLTANTTTFLPLEEWGLELETDEVEFTNFESYGMKTIAGGIRGGTISGSGSVESVAVATILAQYQAQSGMLVEVDLGFKRDTVTPASSLGIVVKAVLTNLTFGNNVKEKATFEFSGTLSNMNTTTGMIDSTQNQLLVIQ